MLGCSELKVFYCIHHKSRWTRENYGPVGSNTDSGSKIRVLCRDTTNGYLAFIIKNLFIKRKEQSKICF